MDRLIDYRLIEPRIIAELRAADPRDDAAKSALGLALADAGCTYEAAHLLRPTRAVWKSGTAAPAAKAALAAQTWWNKNWRVFVRTRHDMGPSQALEILGTRAIQYWDLPPLLMHLGDIAADDGKLDLAEHIFQRIFDLAQRGLPVMPMQAFLYASQSSLIDVMLRRGRAAQALDRLQALAPNPGNAMAHEMLRIRVLVANEQLDQAMSEVAQSLVIAAQRRKGYSKEMRLDFIYGAPDLDPLRARSDWQNMLDDPAGFGR